MLNNKDKIQMSLKKLGLSPDESKVYMALLDGPKSHLALARTTGVNRTKVYRVADELIKRGLIAIEQDDTGKRLAANSPANLEIAITTAEEKIKTQRQLLNGVLPDLQAMFRKTDDSQSSNFVVNTYEGADGFKQMLWNELKTKGELLAFGDGTLQILVDDEAWAEKHRVKTTEAGYTLRELLNPGSKPANFTKNTEFIEKVFRKRMIERSVLPLDQQTVIYNNTVAIYNWHDGKKVGVEIISASYASTMRAVFEHFWNLAQK